MEQNTEHILPLSDAQRADAISTLNLVQQEIRAMRGLFRMTMEGKVVELPIGHYNWQEVPGPGRVQMAAIPPSMWPCKDACTCEGTDNCDTDYFFIRSEKGTMRENIEIAQAEQVQLLYGKVWCWKESAPAYILYQGGDTFSLKAMEKHAFMVEEDFFGNLSFTPKLPSYE